MTETGRIIKIVSSRYEVLAANQERVLCVAMGKLRKAHSPVVGDLVEFERFADQNGIQKILPRKNARPPIHCQRGSGEHRHVLQGPGFFNNPD